MESRTSLPPPAADALFRAAREHATGWLTFSSRGTEARLYLQAGDVVGARLDFGYQTLAQALLTAGGLDLPTLDALWAEGAAGPNSPALLSICGADAAVAEEVQTLASVRRLVSYGGEATFMPALVDAGVPRVSGARAVRAAFETLGPLPADALVYCREVEECAGWLLSEEERSLLERFSTFHPAGELQPGEAALLRLLQHDGRVEILDAAGWEARVAMEREAEARRAEEEARRNVARAAIESARNAEEARRAEQRQRAEQARRALEAARAAEAAWREAQASVPRRDTPIEVALADTLVREAPPAVTATGIGPLPPLESTDPAFPQPSAEEVPRITVAEAIAGGPVLEPDTLRPAVVHTRGGRTNTQKTFQSLRDEGPAPSRSTTEEPLTLSAPETPGAVPKRRDTLRPFAALEPPVLSEAEAQSEGASFPRGSTPIWGSDQDDRAASETLLQAAESVEVVPMPSPEDGTAQSEPILLFADAEVPPAPRSPAELVEEMTEALRRAGAAGPAETWLAATEGVLSSAARGAAEAAAVPKGEASRPPLHLGPDAGKAEEDLWRLVQEPPAGPAPAPASFEEALANVDAHLSSLVGLGQEAVTHTDVPVDAILQASADAGAWQMETLPPVQEPPQPIPPPFEATPALTPSGGVPGEAARERRQRLLRRAIQNLGSLVSRPPRTMGTATPLEPTPAPVPVAIGPRTPAEQGLARQIEQRFVGLSGERNRFDILGLHLEASRPQVKAAFLDLVKVFHPDRLPPALGDLVPQATAIFDSLREAQEFLLDDERRATHAKEMAALASGPPVRDQAESAEAYKAGEAALRRRDHAAAEAHFAEAYRLYPRAHVLAARAWAIYMDPNRKSDAAAARAMMVDALKEDPACDRAHYQLGVIARVEGDVERAERHFREALKANARHLEASQELRLIEMRKRGGPAKKPR
ncbi:MAG: J domain-containing protein [Myxococcaceae bacterium]